MDEGKILLVNLSKGRTGELNSKLLGMVFVMKFQAAAMSRSNIPESERRDFCLYVDEFQNFSTDSFATIMSEARKYHLNLVVANQFTTQLSDEIRDAVFGNIGTIIAFRVGQNNVDILAKYFQPLFEGEDLLRVPNFNTIVRTLINGVPTQSFSMNTMPTLGQPNEELAKALKQLSAAKYGHPKAEVEKEIFARLATIEPPKPLSDPLARYGAATSTPASRPPIQAPKSSATSFLDEWMQKKSSPPANPLVSPPAGLGQTRTAAPSQSSTYATQPQPQPSFTQTQPISAQPSYAQPQPAPIQQPVFSQPVAAAPANNIPQPSASVQPISPIDTSALNIPQNEFKIPHNEPTSPSQVDNTIFIDPSGNVGDSNTVN